MAQTVSHYPESRRRGAASALEVLAAFVKLGMTSFGGPVAHIAYFRTEFVQRRRWLNEQAYADLVALCQFLPGPASSQVGFSLGLMRGGYLGGLAAWIGFTLPSAIVLTAFAYGVRALAGALGQGILHGLRIVAVAVVAEAVWGMARSLCPDRNRSLIALAALCLVLLSPAAIAQPAAIGLGALAGAWLCRGIAPTPAVAMTIPVSHGVGLIALVAFALILLGVPVAQKLTHSDEIALFGAFYHSGALVFGGGHVVLPLLREAVVAPGWVDDSAFLAGYGAAQAVPGPLFTFASYLGAIARIGPRGVVGSAISLIAIFLPGLLILVGTLPFWNQLRHQSGAQATMRGINAAVVGLLGAALYDPVWTTSVTSHADLAMASIGFVLLAVWRVPPLLVVVTAAIWGGALSLMAR
jgi:chromate transporter